ATGGAPPYKPPPQSAPQPKATTHRATPSKAPPQQAPTSKAPPPQVPPRKPPPPQVPSEKPPPPRAPQPTDNREPPTPPPGHPSSAGGPGKPPPSPLPRPKAAPRVHHPDHAATHADGMGQQAPGDYASENTAGLEERSRRVREQQGAAKAPPKADIPARASAHGSDDMEQQTTGGYETGDVR
ncbi:unnamed protein product, partial [Prorocentrum cordatum]